MTNKTLNLAGIELNTEALETHTITDLTTVYNSLVSADRQLKKFKDKATAVERLKPLLVEKLREIGGRDRRKSPVAKDAVIELLAKANPKRPGSKAHERFALYRDGMTVEQAIELGLTFEDLRYDSGKAYIQVRHAA